MQLMDLNDSKEAVYGTLDAWVAWERNFPLVSLKRALLVLQKEEQWHRIVQVEVFIVIDKFHVMTVLLIYIKYH